MMRRLVLLACMAVACLAILGQQAAATHWLSVISLAVSEAGLRWHAPAAWAMAGVGGVMASAALAMGASPGWLWSTGACVVLTAALVSAWRVQIQRKLAHWEGALRETEESETVLEKTREERKALLREREAAIQEMTDMYQLSKQFLGTLDIQEGMRITKEFLGEMAPAWGKTEMEEQVRPVRELVEKGEVSAAALVHAIPLRSIRYEDRERWSILSNQLALGLQRISLYQRVQELASHDSLTGLMVRRYFKERFSCEVETTLERNGSLTFLMVDLDRFKAVNDTYGHLVGDVVLREIARLIRNSVREIDLVGRYGGEEFAVGLPEADARTGTIIAERIRGAVGSAPIHAYDEQIPITVSIGISLCPLHGTTAERLIDQADRAMYRAKGMGRDRTVMAEPLPSVPREK